MAISASSSLSLCFRTTFRQAGHSNAPPLLLNLHQQPTITAGQFSSLSALHLFNKSRSRIMKAIERENTNQQQQPSIELESESSKTTLESTNSESSDSVDDGLGTEIQEAKKKIEGGGGGGGGGDLWSGVVEEIGMIEWPTFGKVLGTTGLVLGVIVGSSVVLLTLNAVLAELSDRVFVGRGVQDFFG